jgi:hypothetical protein
MITSSYEPAVKAAASAPSAMALPDALASARPLRKKVRNRLTGGLA